MAMRKGASSIRDPVLRRAKLTQAMDLLIRKGLPQGEVAALMNVSTKSIDNWQKEAKRNGIIEEIRERMQGELLPKALRVYNDILDQSAEHITEQRTGKAHELKLKAAKSLAEGLGVLRKDSTQTKLTQRLDIDGYFEMRRARNALADKGSAPLPIIEAERVLALEAGVGEPTQLTFPTSDPYPQQDPPYEQNREHRLSETTPHPADPRGEAGEGDRGRDRREVLDWADRGGSDQGREEGSRFVVQAAGGDIGAELGEGGTGPDGEDEGEWVSDPGLAGEPQ